MIWIIIHIAHLFGSHSEDPTGKNPGKCCVCGRDLP